MHLPCDFQSAHPTPVVSWYKDDSVIASNAESDLIQSTSFTAQGRYIILPDGGIQIRSSGQLDSGTYRCTGKNAAGLRQGNRYHLNVSGKQVQLFYLRNVFFKLGREKLVSSDSTEKAKDCSLLINYYNVFMFFFLIIYFYV